MKKRVLCIFSLIFFLLISCTMMSFRIEDIMMTRVKTQKISAMTGQTSVSISALFYDDFGNHLYLTEEGTGWESGQRITEMETSMYSVDKTLGRVFPLVYATTDVIVTGTRQPIVGSQVVVVKEEEKTPDELLLYYPGERTKSGSFPTGVTMTVLGNHSMLLSAEKTPQPYMEHQAKGWLSAQEMPLWRIFSLTEVKAFLGYMPLVALLAAMILLCVMLWGYSCVLARDPWQNRVPLWINVGVAVVILCCMPLVINAIDLPSAMLPSENILDFNHYKTEFAQLTAALKDLGDCSQAVDVLQKMNTATFASVGVLLGGSLCGAGVIAAEWFLIRRKKQQES